MASPIQPYQRAMASPIQLYPRAMASSEEDPKKVLEQAKIYMAAMGLESLRDDTELYKLKNDADVISSIGEVINIPSTFFRLGKYKGNRVLYIYKTKDYVYLIQDYTDGSGRVDHERLKRGN